MSEAPRMRRVAMASSAVIVALVLLLAGIGLWRRADLPHDAASASRAADRPGSPSTASGAEAKATGGAAPEAAAGASGDAGDRALHPFDIANAALGARIESVTSQRDAERWSAAGLIDGGTGDVTCSPLCAWGSADDALPQEIVLSFHERREALVARVVIDTLTPITREQSAGVPREIELWASTSSAAGDFTRIASATLPAQSMRHAIDVEPVSVRFLKVRVLSRHGGRQTLIGEISVLESVDRPSILTDVLVNLAAPSLGGAIVSYTSDYASFRASNLVDGDPATEWRAGTYGLPQEFVFAFHEDRVALVESVTIDAGARLTALPKAVAISVSTTSPVEGFDDVGQFPLEQRAGGQTLAVGRRARFLKLRIVEGYGGDTILTSLAEIGVLEGAEPGYESVFRRSGEPGRFAGRERSQAADGDPSADDLLEQEPNDTLAQAGRLEAGRAVRGAVDPIGENDYFRLSVPGTERSALTVELSAVPYIRTALDLLDTSGSNVQRFDPSRAPATSVSFSWIVPAGDYALRLTDPPASVVLVWDTSGSMKGREQDLQRAVEAYLDDVPPDQQVNMIRFSHNVETILPEFSNDRSRLKAAVQGKFYAKGSTPLYDAVAQATRLLEARGGNRAIVVMSDGEDGGSRLTRPEFWTLLQQRKIRLYAIGIGDTDRYSRRLGTSAGRLMKHAALATGGDGFFARESSALAGFYREIANELRTACRYRLRITSSNAIGRLRVHAAGTDTIAVPPRIELILDASGSMKRRAGGRTMIDAAKEALAGVIQELPDDVHVALRVYGHRIPEGRRGACEDSQLVFPFARIDKPRLIARIREIKALGTTPIAHSLRQVARDMGRAPGEKIVVLVTDGKEECRGDPTAAVQALRSAGVDLRLNVVGFALADERLKAELRALAELTSGQFVDAHDTGSLRAAIQRSLAVPYDVLDGGGNRVGGGLTGDAVELPEGVYTVAVRAADKRIEIPAVRVAAGETASVVLRKEGREIAVARQ